MTEKIGAHAKVTLTVAVDVGSSWGDNCPISQIHRQATEDALEVLTNPNIYCDYIRTHRVKIVGKPKVDAVIVTRE